MTPRGPSEGCLFRQEWGTRSTPNRGRAHRTKPADESAVAIAVPPPTLLIMRIYQ